MALPTTNPFQLLLVPSQLVRIDSEVDFPSQLCVSGLPRMSRDLIRDRNLGMRLLDSSVGAFAITSLGAHADASLLHW